MADKNKLTEKGFTYLMGDGVIVYDAKETETEARERLWQRTLQIAAVPMGLRAGDLDEIREWMGAEAVKVPANLATGKRGDIAHFTFDSEATANEYAGSIVTFRNIQRKVVCLFKKEGNTFKRVYCCWTCGDSSHMKQECNQFRRGMITENELLNYAAGMNMNANKEKRIGEAVRNSVIKKRNIYRGNEMAYSAALKRAGAMATEEGKAAARMGQTGSEKQRPSPTPKAWSTPKEWGEIAEQRTMNTGVTDLSINERLSKMEELLATIGRGKEEDDNMEMEVQNNSATAASIGSAGTKKRPERSQVGMKNPPTQIG